MKLDTYCYNCDHGSAPHLLDSIFGVKNIETEKGAVLIVLRDIKKGQEAVLIFKRPRIPEVGRSVVETQLHQDIKPSTLC